MPDAPHPDDPDLAAEQAHVDGEVATAAWEPVVGDVGVLDLRHDADAVGGGLAGLRVFAGYAAWERGQVEAEIGEGAWYVVPAEPTDAFTGEPDGLWRAVLARQPGELARVALVPADPSVN
jgi:putative transcriptional regulator